MNETFLLGIGIILCMLTWKYAVKPTYLDSTRDELFDLRDHKLKAFFLSSEGGLHDPMYVRMRGLLNDLLRYTENASLMGFLFTLAVLARHTNKLDELNTLHESEFKSDDPTISAFCEEVRYDANAIMMRYMIRTSLLGQLLRAVAAFYAFTRVLIRSLRTHHRPLWRAACSAATSAALVTNVAAHVAPGVSGASVKNAFEARAMRQI